MSINDILDEVLALKPKDRYLIIEKLNDSLSAPNPEVEKEWIGESMRRSEANDRNELDTVSYEEVFGK
jgi:putative addiction module component (TIGR02574 family)